MWNRLLHKLEVIAIWIIISVGLYQCSTMDSAKPDVTEKNQKGIQSESQERQEQPKEKEQSIRVLIKTSGFTGNYHEELVFSSENGMYIEQNKQIRSFAPNEEFVITDKELLEKQICIKAYKNGRIRLHNVARTEDVLYRGNMECMGTEDGIVLVNELSVEEYLYGVVPSEMPSSYPAEALKAQAVSARTYTYFQMSSFAYPEWRAHVDDSTAFQVYQNICEKENVNQAVDDTRNQVIRYQGELIESFYYSTSSGRSSGFEVWKPQEERGWLQGKALVSGQQRNGETTDFSYDKKDTFERIQEKEQAYRTYIRLGNVNDVECQEAWYRWEYTKDVTDIQGFLKRVEAVAEKNPYNVSIRSKYKEGEKLTQESEILSCRVLQREASGMAQQLWIQTKNYEIIIRTQQCIREVLAKSGDVIRKNDGTEFTLGELLPSAYFYFDALYEGNCLKSMTIYGGGFGHGAGMSQNGAKCLAENGMKAEDILKYYYTDVVIEEL